jgi:hypothetical protein
MQMEGCEAWRSMCDKAPEGLGQLCGASEEATCSGVMQMYFHTGMDVSISISISIYLYIYIYLYLSIYPYLYRLERLCALQELGAVHTGALCRRVSIYHDPRGRSQLPQSRARAP